MHEDDDASSKASKVAPPLGDAPPPGNLFGKTRGSRPSSPGSNPMGLADEVQTSRKMVLLLEKGIRQLSLDFYSWDHLRIS